MTEQSSAPRDAGETKGQAPASGDGAAEENSSAQRTMSLDDLTAQIARLNQEAAHHRHERNEARKERDALALKVRQAEEAKLAEQGQWKELAEQRELEKAEAERRAQETVSAMGARLIDATLRQALAAKGLTDPKQQDYLLPALRSKATLTKDLQVGGKYGDAIEDALSALGIGKAAPPPPEPEQSQPQKSAAYDALSGLIPSTANNTTPDNPRDRIRSRLREAIGQ